MRISDWSSDVCSSELVDLVATCFGYTEAKATIVVTDESLPDLIVAEVTGPDTAETEAFVNLSYKVVNQGLAPAGTNWLTQVFLSDAIGRASCRERVCQYE